MERPQKLQIVFGTFAALMATSKAFDIYSKPARLVDLLLLGALALIAGLMWGRFIEHRKLTANP